MEFDLKKATVKGLGLQAEDLKISGFDLRDALVGRSVAYEFDVEIDNKILPFKLLEDVNRWEDVDLPIFQEENALAERRGMENRLPVLSPFQLAGPMELWIQDAKDMRLSLPSLSFHMCPSGMFSSNATELKHDVDAGVLRKVILAEGAMVTVKGARSVSLRHPIELPLPLNRSQNSFASGLLALAEHLRHTSCTQNSPLLSLRIVGPTSLTSPSTSPSSTNRLKLKRLAPGLVELSSLSKTKSPESISTIHLQGEAPTLLTPKHFTTLWPLTSINGSNSNLRGFEKLLYSVLGQRLTRKADVSAQTFVKIGFGIERELKQGEGSGWEGFPKWRTKPETVKMHFEVLAKVDGDKVVPERVVPVNPVEVEDSVAQNVIERNKTMTKIPIFHPPVSPFYL
ncbi:unnamed protein product [Thlaspi arvense]|uniref:Tunicamycin induced 1 n=1 Tax=Thlaspi arvense TaxID=13288 RepID=A0AAU9RQX1_THLAR|nr:unnamed protein product [Thlaspi arvense]